MKQRIFISSVQEDQGEAQEAHNGAPTGTKSALSRHQVKIARMCLVVTGISELMSATGGTDRTKLCFQIVNALRSQSVTKHILRAIKEICIYQDLHWKFKEEINRKNALVVRKPHEVYG